ncbi:uncharacterized protein LOC130517527 [Takifugu flavidus]|uniref:uncharacterized protein LOC130517527 n=1 Tax=Takifugu flavidus TaxID=433684 RepID=UPI002543FD21|nr:uncharacterized protein LOC130517527 [Takifugu flavidus]
MLPRKEEKRTFSNGPLRDQWEKRAQSVADQQKQEAEWKKKSSVKLCHSKWNYHWSLVSNGDFSKLNKSNDDEKNKPKIKFKIIPPPPKAKPKVPPPPPPKKAPSPKLPRPKRRVEVDVFRLYWKDSWMSLKPPKYLYLKAKEQKIEIPGFTTIMLANARKYKPQVAHTDTEWVFPAYKWTQCWKQVRHLLHLESYEGKHFDWETFLERQGVCKPQIKHFTLPVWAGTWKIMNFAFRQEKPKWDCGWPEYEQPITNKSDKVEELEEENEPSNWEDSWKLSGVESNLDDSKDEAIVEINEVFMPGWSDSWQLASSPVEEEEHHKKWSICWSFRQQMRWCQPSLQAHHHHSHKLTRVAQKKTFLHLATLDNDITDSSEWKDAWRAPKRWVPPEEAQIDEMQEDRDETEGMEEEEEEEEEEEKMRRRREKMKRRRRREKMRRRR